MTPKRRSCAGLIVAMAVIILDPGGGNARAQLDEFPLDGRYCTGTATAIHESCRSEGEPAYWKAVAACSNIGDDEERAECF